ncbi:hypothetical protein GALMADRAFT_244156 [Galerina marginata CBS 339.88]|uniref:Beta-glucuronidase C-terminal domain-containing protein n=1 Tax=Galerina marginata (strain CBS 339.88) TaxID=685588 RepID=A0A067TFH9_GALM3|nr:hypothetical protein GALMADRAFT_244156 [Galerina marginata CBS 339.88]
MFNCPILRPLTLLALFSSYALCGSVTVSVPFAAPSSAPTISPSVISLSIELDRWTDWSGNTTRNQFFFNTLNNLKQIAGEGPRLRIGGDTEDHADFSPTVKYATATFKAPTAATPYFEASNVIVGDGFYQVADFVPPGTHFTWGVNFKRGNMTTMFSEARSLLKAFASPALANMTLDYIEIGNEVGGMTLPAYVQEWTGYATNITSSLNMGKTKFWGGAFAATTHTTDGFSPQGIFANGILNSHPGSLMTSFSQHHYSGGCTPDAPITGKLQYLMDKALLRSNLTHLNADIAAVHAQGLDYVLGETNSNACHGTPGVSNVGGTALWMLDHAIFGAEIGISRMYFHEGIGYKYNLIQPVTLTISTIDGTPLPKPLPPHVQPQYYGAIVAAEAIGNSGATRVVELSINDPRISGHAFFVGNKLVRAVIINSLVYLTTDAGTPRNSTLVNLNISGSGAPTKMTVKRLFMPFSDSTSGLTWGGQTYETSDGRVGGSLKVTTANVADGVVVQASEAVLLTFM